MKLDSYLITGLETQTSSETMPDKRINPIIPGFAPDPSIVRVGDTYFLANSSFHIFPGLPIYASKNLVSCKHIGKYLYFTYVLSV
jgi:beta-xylosidase